MKFRIFLLSLCLVYACATSALADVRIWNDAGGEISSYLHRAKEARASGELTVIDGPCMSACTLLVFSLPKDKVCVTPRAELGFHVASTDLAGLHPSKVGTQVVMQIYPPSIRSWIARHGGLKRDPIYLRGAELDKFVQPCP